MTDMREMEKEKKNLLKYDGNHSPTVSVIMNCLNGEKFLREALDSVFAQTYESWEIIYWEDVDSSDNSGEIAKSYGSKVIPFKADKKLPLYGARNQAIHHAQGKYIAILDCDDIWLPSKLEKQISFLEDNSDVALVYSDCIVFNEAGREKRFFDIVNPERGMVFSKLLLSNFINTQTVVIRREALDNFNTLFDGRLHMSGDYDAYLRISHKWRLDYVDEPLARYRVHVSSMTTTDSRRLLSHEIGLTLETLCSTIPGFKSKYFKEYYLMQRRMNVQLALIDWENGNKKKARQRIKPYIRSSLVHLSLYLLAFLPFKYFFNPFYRMYNKNLMAD